MTMRIAVAGAGGRMGRMLIDAIAECDDARLSAALDVEGSPAIGRDAGEGAGRMTGVRITPDIDQALAASDMLVDFTRPEGTLRHLQACLKRGVGCVIGTTGFDDTGKAAIAKAAESIPVVFSPNMAVGVNVTYKLLEVAASILSSGYDIEIIEAHHRHKVDAPSGTALRMGEVIARSLGRRLDDVAVYGREGVTGERKASTIGFSAIRGGDIVGDHTVLFAGTGERIEITHRSASRASYALGAMRACRFIANRKPGLFDMQDVLGLR
jgi:4-hydroxy-tetrahydrodipicolinate reductase